MRSEVCIGVERECQVTLKFFAKDEDVTGRRAAAQAAETLKSCPVLMQLCVIPETREFIIELFLLGLEAEESPIKIASGFWQGLLSASGRSVLQ